MSDRRWVCGARVGRKCHCGGGFALIAGECVLADTSGFVVVVDVWSESVMMGLFLCSVGKWVRSFEAEATLILVPRDIA